MAGADQQQSAEYTRALPQPRARGGRPRPATATTRPASQRRSPRRRAAAAPGLGDMPKNQVAATPCAPSTRPPTPALATAAPIGCGGAETYLRFDPTALELVTEREAIRVAWYATGRRYTAARTRCRADEREAFSDGHLDRPRRARRSHLWIVSARRLRGGADWRELTNPRRVAPLRPLAQHAASFAATTQPEAACAAIKP